jgi:hypothetical protein
MKIEEYFHPDLSQDKLIDIMSILEKLKNAIESTEAKALIEIYKHEDPDLERHLHIMYPKLYMSVGVLLMENDHTTAKELVEGGYEMVIKTLTTAHLRLIERGMLEKL